MTNCWSFWYKILLQPEWQTVCHSGTKYYFNQNATLFVIVGEIIFWTRMMHTLSSWVKATNTVSFWYKVLFRLECQTVCHSSWNNILNQNDEPFVTQVKVTNIASFWYKVLLHPEWQTVCHSGWNNILNHNDEHFVILGESNEYCVILVQSIILPRMTNCLSFWLK